MILPRIFILALALVTMPVAPVSAHALEPGYLEISVLSEDSLRVFWRKPDVKGQPMRIEADLPKKCDARRGPTPKFDGRAWVTRWVAVCPGGLAGGLIKIEGLENQRTDVLVRYETVSGQALSHRLTPASTSFEIPENPSFWNVFRSYLPLGVEHILAGWDHLLFVFALLLLITDVRRLVGAITAFTIAHSITMAAATLGWVTLPGPPVEAIIALSIMFVASEFVLRDSAHQRVSERYPWIVSFSFGLLHGFGFAGALREIGLPQTDVPLALLAFNLGVEIGQLIFVAAVVLIGLILRALWPTVRRLLDPGAEVGLFGAYAIGGVSAYWFIDRVASF